MLVPLVPGISYLLVLLVAPLDTNRSMLLRENFLEPHSRFVYKLLWISVRRVNLSPKRDCFSKRVVYCVPVYVPGTWYQVILLRRYCVNRKALDVPIVTSMPLLLLLLLLLMLRLQSVLPTRYQVLHIIVVVLGSGRSCESSGHGLIFGNPLSSWIASPLPCG